MQNCESCNYEIIIAKGPGGETYILDPPAITRTFIESSTKGGVHHALRAAQGQPEALQVGIHNRWLAEHHCRWAKPKKKAKARRKKA